MQMSTQLLILLLVTLLCNGFECSSGCRDGCIADYICKSGCYENYYNDTSCLYCGWNNKNYVLTKAYISNGTMCSSSDNVIVKTGWLPNESYVSQIELGESVSVELNEESYVDESVCSHRQKIRPGKWFKFDSNTFGQDDFAFIKITKVNNFSTTLTIDVSNSEPQDKDLLCFASSTILKTDEEGYVKIPVIKTNDTNEAYWYYFFVSLDELINASFNVTLTSSLGVSGNTQFVLDQQIADYLAEDSSRTIVIRFPIQSKGVFTRPMCAKSLFTKSMLMRTKFKGSYSIVADSTPMDRVNHFQEYIKGTIDSTAINSCKQLWYGKKIGPLAEVSKNGFVVRIKAETDENGDAKERYFAILTEDQTSDVEVTFRAICPNDCNKIQQNGYCMTAEHKCKCKDGYGGDDCHLKCYHNGKWQVDDHSKLCYFGSSHCDQWCGCEEGYELVNNYCVSKSCASGGVASDDECYQGSEGCLINCQCQSEFGWKKGKEGKCVNAVCGNGILDELYDIDGFIGTEECDNGTNCNSYCHCSDGFIPNPNNPGSCHKENISTGAIVAISVGSGSGVLIFIVVMVILVILLTRYKKIETNIYKQQQPTYHYYIQGSSKTTPNKESRYDVSPLDLDYGNRNNATSIRDTRYEKIEIKNYSRNKWMMVIFHTPNNPKYVFHFEPQVIIIRPHSTPKIITSYMTLQCTTKIRDMKIPYTVWFSKSKSTLESIEELLKDKTFDDWNQDDQNRMDKLCKNVIKHYHYSLVVKTDAASSTFLDMDELNMSEKPIAEGANGRVFIGSYRSVPVAIKQFRWENLTDEEMKELKQEVINECEIMKKLRNPFIANYMGSVTYVSQVSMVIQFFVLGSLGEYLRKDKEDYVKLPYKLKIRMLFDTARGMQFLHENNILHLDLKPDNLLVNSLYTDSACCIKITDFGTSRFTKKTNKSGDKGLGTPIYASPESYHDEYTFAGDVYSFAITTWELFYQEEPYKEFKSLFEIRSHVESGKRLGFDETIPLLLRTLIQECWKNEPKERPTFDQITKSIVKIDDDIANHIDLGANVSDGKIEELIQKRTQRMQRQLNEISHE